MTAPARLGVFAAALAAVFVASFALGTVTDDDDDPTPPTTTVSDHDDHG